MNFLTAVLTAIITEVKQRKILTAVTVLILVGSLISIYRTTISAAPKKISPQMMGAGLGQVLGEETVKAIGGHGRVVIVISDDCNQSGDPMNCTLEVFRGILKKHPNIEITGTEVIQSDAMITGELPSGLFNGLVKKHSNVDGLVFFTGLPRLEAQPPLQLPTTHPQIIALQINPPLTKPYFKRQIVNVAINIKAQVDLDSSANLKTPREWFDKYFDVITTQNVATLMD